MAIWYDEILCMVTNRKSANDANDTDYKLQRTCVFSKTHARIFIIFCRNKLSYRKIVPEQKFVKKCAN